jgi:hypothetical protein
MELLLGTQ